MKTPKELAGEIIDAITNGEDLAAIKLRLCGSDQSLWFRSSALAYAIGLKKQNRERKANEKKRHVVTTSRADIKVILKVNSILANHALSMPITSTVGHLRDLEQPIKKLPASESEIIEMVGKVTMNPLLRVRQKKGRFEKFDHFALFVKMIDAACLSYYRTNFISCYLTLLPIIEGIIIRWMGYKEGDEKPEFEDIRKFFKTAHVRQPYPSNIEFHEVYSKACDKILNEHFYKPSNSGRAHSNFNRHVASHILNDGQFATKDNCIRLFLLIDLMSEIYLLERRIADPRFALTAEEVQPEADIYIELLLNNLNHSAEHILLQTNVHDILKL